MVESGANFTLVKSGSYSQQTSDLSSTGAYYAFAWFTLTLSEWLSI